MGAVSVTGCSCQFCAQLLNARAPVVDGFVAAAAQRFVVPEGSGSGDQVGNQARPRGAGAAAGAQLGHLGLQLFDALVGLGQPLAIGVLRWLPHPGGDARDLRRRHQHQAAHPRASRRASARISRRSSCTLRSSPWATAAARARSSA
ncbi:hypothetical protein G6F59_016731 [Rhizopus arrhizus]|nr:hypothetical protein G6F59_016731 [Rhizopus arrhizus]